MSVATGIKKIIADKALAQGKIAVRAGFTPQQFSEMMHNRKTIRAEYMPRIAKAMGVDINEIYEAGERDA